MIVLGLETSCDETAAAVVRDDGYVISDVVSSQVALHAAYGGVVPELAARAHIRNVVPVLEQALTRAGLDLGAVDAVAVTQGPGLVGALLVGTQVGKSIALSRGMPLVGVNHLIGHLLSAHLYRGEEAPPGLPYPYVALLVSGGHTALYEVRSSADIEQLGQTRDDAAGEAFDKVAKLLGLGYPGGPRIDKLAAEGDPSSVRLPRPLRHKGSLEFSFSGLKTAVAQHLRSEGVPSEPVAVANLCASFQHVVVSSLVDKALEACRVRCVPRLVIAGGVAANKGLRALATARCAEAGYALTIPPFAACTDNAAMIAYAGACRLRAGERDGLGLEVYSRSPVLGVAKGAQRRYRSQRLAR